MDEEYLKIPTQFYCIGYSPILGCPLCTHFDNWLKLRHFPEPLKLALQERMIYVTLTACRFAKNSYYKPLPSLSQN